MPRKRSQVPDELDDDEAELLVSKAQMDRELADRIDLGSQLLRQVQDQMKLSSMSDGMDDRLRAEFSTWDEYNERLLARRFSTAQVVADYRTEPFPT